MPSPEHIVFVDPFSSTQFLADSLRAASIKVSAVYTKNPRDGYIAQRPELFDDCFNFKSHHDISELAKDLIAAGVTRVYYGSELSVPFADKLTNLVCPQWANDETTSLYRCDKYQMQEALKIAGLPSVNQTKMSPVLSEKEEKILENAIFPVVVKPVNHGAAFGVSICHNLEQTRNALQSLAADNPFDYSNEHCLIQEHLMGEEYFIDTFSENGKHHISGVQRYQRDLINGRPISRYAEIIDPENNAAQICIEYVLKSLSAVGLKNGFAHTEVMLTANGPRLIEVNPRISGAYGTSNKLFQYCGFPSQVALLIDSSQKGSTDKYYGRKVYLQNQKEQHPLKPLNTELLATLPSFIEALMLKKPGTIVSLPQSLIDTVAFVLLVNKNEQQLLKDYQKIIEWEKAELLF